MHLLGWIPPVVPACALAFIVAVAIIVTGGTSLSPRQKGLSLLATVVSGAALLAVAVQWWLHRDGARDWLHGGVTYIDRDNSSQLGWVDWALVVTRRGLVHPRARRLRLETRVFLGLLPISSHEIKLSQSDHAQASHRNWTAGPQMGWDRGWALPEGADSGFFTRVRVRSDHVVELMSESDGPVRLLDISTRTQGDASADFVRRLAGRINQRLGEIDWSAPSRRPASG